MTELVIQSGKLQGKRLLLPAKTMIVGRDDDCDMKISSSLVSRKHCSLTNTPEGVVVVDLGSQNGTYVNDVAITEPTLLSDGDYLRIGALLLAVLSSTKIKLPPGAPQSKISDAEIAEWLTESNANVLGTDTAVIPTFPPQPKSVTPQATVAAPAPIPPVAPVQKPSIPKALSVKDEAAEVIRKHWEMVKAKQKH